MSVLHGEAALKYIREKMAEEPVPRMRLGSMTLDELAEFCEETGCVNCPVSEWAEHFCVWFCPIRGMKPAEWKHEGVLERSLCRDN